MKIMRHQTVKNYLCEIEVSFDPLGIIDFNATGIDKVRDNERS